MALKGLKSTEQLFAPHFTLPEAKLTASLPGKIVSLQSQRVLCNAVLFYSPMAGSLRTTETDFAAGEFLPHKMKYLKSIYIPIPNIKNDSPSKSFGLQISCAQPSKTPFLAS